MIRKLVNIILLCLQVTGEESFMIKFRNSNMNGGNNAAYTRYEKLCTNCSNIHIGSFEGIVGKFELNTLKSLYFDEFVEAISLDRNIEAASVQNFAPKHLARISQRHRILRHQTMDYVYENHTSTVYLLDSGICSNCSEFGDRVISSENQRKEEFSEHGTEVASILGGETLGAAKNAIMIDYKVLNENGRGKMSDVLLALEKINEKKVDGVILLPFVGRRNFILDSAISEMVEAGFIVVAAAGNYQADACLFSPSGSSSVITVGSVDVTTDELAPFSNYGPCVNLYADGVNLETMTTNGSVILQSGTSFSAALVAGVVSSVFTLNSTMGGNLNEIITEIRTPKAGSTNLRQFDHEIRILSYLAKD